jgi:hypothetical protein
MSEDVIATKHNTAKIMTHIATIKMGSERRNSTGF